MTAIPYPIPDTVPDGTNLGAGGSLAEVSYVCMASGTVIIAVCLASSSVLQIVRNGHAAAINEGTALNAATEYDFNFPVFAGDVINFQLVSSSVVTYFRAFFRQTM